MPIISVKIYTDGLRDLVDIPGRPTLSLGKISVRKLLETSARAPVEETLREFANTGAVLVPLDLDAASTLFEWRPRRVLAGNPKKSLVDVSYREGARVTKEKVEHGIARLYGLTMKMASKLKAKQPVGELTDEFRRTFAKIHFPSYGDQSKNDAFYVEPREPDTVDDKQTLPKEITNPKMASSQVLESSQKLAEEILDQGAEIEGAISIKESDPEFNAGVARMDLHGIVSKVAYLSENANMAEPWVEKELTDLHKTAGRILNYFKKSANDIIETRPKPLKKNEERSPHKNYEWSSEGLGPDNYFSSVSKAQRAVKELKGHGKSVNDESWTNVEYRFVDDDGRITKLAGPENSGRTLNYFKKSTGGKHQNAVVSLSVGRTTNVAQLTPKQVDNILEVIANQVDHQHPAKEYAGGYDDPREYLAAFCYMWQKVEREPYEIG